MVLGFLKRKHLLKSGHFALELGPGSPSSRNDAGWTSAHQRIKRESEIILAGKRMRYSTWIIFKNIGALLSNSSIFLNNWSSLCSYLLITLFTMVKYLFLMKRGVASRFFFLIICCLFMAVLGLRCCPRSGCPVRAPGGSGFSCWWPQALEHAG